VTEAPEAKIDIDNLGKYDIMPSTESPSVLQDIYGLNIKMATHHFMSGGE
jgi:hypothetical protein